MQVVMGGRRGLQSALPCSVPNPGRTKDMHALHSHHLPLILSPIHITDCAAHTLFRCSASRPDNTSVIFAHGYDCAPLVVAHRTRQSLFRPADSLRAARHLQHSLVMTQCLPTII